VREEKGLVQFYDIKNVGQLEKEMDSYRNIKLRINRRRFNPVVVGEATKTWDNIEFCVPKYSLLQPPTNPSTPYSP